MPKSSSNDLFLLIKSLTKSEKWHFKLYASGKKGGKENNYIKLFDAIEKQSRKLSGEYDEDALIKTEKYIKQLPLLKNRLYETVLESLDVLYAGNSIESQLQNLLHYIEILFEKELYIQCEKKIQKAKLLAVKYEKFLYQAEISKWEIELMGATSYLAKTEHDIENVFLELNASMKKEQYSESYRRVHAKLFIRIKKRGFTRSREEMKSFQKIFTNQASPENDKHSSFRALFYYYQSCIAYNLSQNNSKKRLLYLKKQLQLFESHPEYIKEKPRSYMGVLHNLCSCQADLHQYNDAFVSLEKIKAIPANSQRTGNSIFYSSNYLALVLYTGIGQFEVGLKLVDKIVPELDSHYSKLIGKQFNFNLYYLIVYTYFGNARYAKANHYLNKILNDPDRTENDLRTDIYCFTKIFSIIIHFELGKEDLLEYTIKSTYRYLYKKNRLYEFENIILNFLRKNSSKNTSPNQQLTMFKKLKVALENIANDPFERRAMDYFDFISWLDSKIENRAFAEIVRKRTLSLK